MLICEAAKKKRGKTQWREPTHFLLLCVNQVLVCWWSSRMFARLSQESTPTVIDSLLKPLVTSASSKYSRACSFTEDGVDVHSGKRERRRMRRRIRRRSRGAWGWEQVPCFPYASLGICSTCSCSQYANFHCSRKLHARALSCPLNSLSSANVIKSITAFVISSTLTRDGIDPSNEFTRGRRMLSSSLLWRRQLSFRSPNSGPWLSPYWTSASTK